LKVVRHLVHLLAKLLLLTQDVFQLLLVFPIRDCRPSAVPGVFAQTPSAGLRFLQRLLQLIGVLRLLLFDLAIDSSMDGKRATYLADCALCPSGELSRTSTNRSPGRLGRAATD
jgi:hypothetical protein